MTEKNKDEKVVYCDNHPDRKAQTFTGGGAYEIHLCEECKPEWPL